MTFYSTYYYRCFHCGAVLPIEQLVSYNTFSNLAETEWSDGWRQFTPVSVNLIECSACNTVLWLPSCDKSRGVEATGKGQGLTGDAVWRTFVAAREITIKRQAAEAEDLPFDFQVRDRDAFLNDLLRERFSIRTPPAQQPSPPAPRMAEHDAPAIMAELARKLVHTFNHPFRVHLGQPGSLPYGMESGLGVEGFRRLTPEEQDRRLQALAALAESLAKSSQQDEHAAVQRAEWQREAGSFYAAERTLNRVFADAVCADLAAQMRVLVQCHVAFPVHLAVTDVLRTRLLREARERWEAQQMEARQREAELAARQTPACLLTAVATLARAKPAMQLLQDLLPSKLLRIMKANVAGYGWPVNEMPAALCKALVQVCGAGPEPAQLRAVAQAPVDPRIVEFLAHALRDTSWSEWSYSPVGKTPPNLRASS